ncbi:hypothetical protein [Salmonella phage NINP13076]|nr:hypothetical protein [Salmonella phage NINP13076]
MWGAYQQIHLRSTLDTLFLDVIIQIWRLRKGVR